MQMGMLTFPTVDHHGECYLFPMCKCVEMKVLVKWNRIYCECSFYLLTEKWLTVLSLILLSAYPTSKWCGWI